MAANSTLIINARLAGTHAHSRLLRGEELADLPCLDDGWLLTEGSEIAGLGRMAEMPDELRRRVSRERIAVAGAAGADRGVAVVDGGVIDAGGCWVLPAWCDSHTHLVFAGSREAEFVDKIRGMSYAEINARGGGILNSARLLQETSEDVLFNQAWARLGAVSRLGTGSIEIKSGYGLSVEGELKMLRVIRRLRERSSLSIKSTFLGAHSFPPAYKEDHAGYIDLLIREMLPVIAREKLADYIDVFCEGGFFSPAETETICRAGMSYGLQPKIHANQLSLSGGVETGVRLGAVSVDHLEMMDDAAIEVLRGSDTIGTLLPTAAFFLRMPFQPARRLIDAGCAIALASDYNPGSSPSGNMNLVVAMSCIQMRMLPEEAINAATLNGAIAMGLGASAGSLTIGKRADLIITRPAPSLAYLPYSFGSDLIGHVMIGGGFVH